MIPFEPIDFGDTLRGTKGIMVDMYRRPEKLQEAMERIIPITIDSAVRGTDASGCPVVFMPLHKGPAGFMSGKQFETFYWPTLRKVMMGLIEEGLVPFPFAEGDYMPRLEIIKDVPRGKVIWYFEAMDMAKAKKVSATGPASPVICLPPYCAPERPERSKKVAVDSLRLVLQAVVIS